MEASYVGERQSKPTICIHREKIQLNEQTLPHQHKLLGEAEVTTSPRPTVHVSVHPTPTPQYTHIKTALVQARPADINIELCHPAPNEQKADRTDSGEATGRTRRRHDANSRVIDIPHNRNQ